MPPGPAAARPSPERWSDRERAEKRSRLLRQHRAPQRQAPRATSAVASPRADARPPRPFAGRVPRPPRAAAGRWSLFLRGRPPGHEPCVLELVQKGPIRNAERLRGLDAVPVGLLEHADDRLALRRLGSLPRDVLEGDVG